LRVVLILLAFGLALLLIFLILAAQFESFIDPFIIILTVPMAVAGALFSLWLFDQLGISLVKLEP
jgi:HAE1 family hydrophobic/amphiphilic exporter-1/multidrug efflux pump